MKRWMHTWAWILALGLALTGCGGSQAEPETAGYNPHFNATVLEIQENTILVEPTDGPDRPAADEVLIPLKEILRDAPVPELQEGSAIRVVYNGDVAETAPAQLDTVFAIFLLDEDGAVSETVDRTPMVMVDGILYLDTGKESTIEHTCGTMDGEITSTVDASQQPTIDGQSNFGSSYGYQVGAWGTIDVLMDDTWWVFESEERRQALQDDPWGLVLAAQNVTPTGLTLVCTQSGKHPDGEFQTGSFFVLEQLVENQWTAVPAMDPEIVWTSEAWSIPLEATQYWQVHWEQIYGELSAGTYRIGKDITGSQTLEDSDTSRYYAEFTIA